MTHTKSLLLWISHELSTAKVYTTNGHKVLTRPRAYCPVQWRISLRALTFGTNPVKNVSPRLHAGVLSASKSPPRARRNLSWQAVWGRAVRSALKDTSGSISMTVAARYSGKGGKEPSEAEKNPRVASASPFEGKCLLPRVATYFHGETTSFGGDTLTSKVTRPQSLSGSIQTDPLRLPVERSPQYLSRVREMAVMRST